MKKIVSAGFKIYSVLDAEQVAPLTGSPDGIHQYDGPAVPDRVDLSKLISIARDEVSQGHELYDPTVQLVFDTVRGEFIIDIYKEIEVEEIEASLRWHCAQCGFFNETPKPGENNCEACGKPVYLKLPGGSETACEG